jgi:hypothetical protein
MEQFSVTDLETFLTKAFFDNLLPIIQPSWPEGYSEKIQKNSFQSLINA